MQKSVDSSRFFDMQGGDQMVSRPTGNGFMIAGNDHLLQHHLVDSTRAMEHTWGMEKQAVRLMER